MGPSRTKQEACLLFLLLVFAVFLRVLLQEQLIDGLFLILVIHSDQEFLAVLFDRLSTIATRKEEPVHA